MNMLGLDIATRVGWCRDDSIGGGAVPVTGAMTLEGDDARAALQLGKWLVRAIATYRIERVVIEAPLLGGFGVTTNAETSIRLIGLAFVAKVTAASQGIPGEWQSVQTVRAAFLGRGRIPKGMGKSLVRARCADLGWPVASDDAADAACVWHWAKLAHDKGWRPVPPQPLFATRDDNERPAA